MVGSPLFKALLSLRDALEDDFGTFLCLGECSPKYFRHLPVSGDESGFEWLRTRLETRHEVQTANLDLNFLAINDIPTFLDIVGPEHACPIDHDRIVAEVLACND